MVGEWNREEGRKEGRKGLPLKGWLGVLGIGLAGMVFVRSQNVGVGTTTP